MLPVDFPLELPPEYARSWLLVSAAYPDNFDISYYSQADIVILDLEDGTPPHLKQQGRDNIVQWVNRTNHNIWVRINSYGTPEWEGDLQTIAPLPQVVGIMLAKTETISQLDQTVQACAGHQKFFVAQIESALGLINIVDIAKHPQTFGLAFGVNDFCEDTGIHNDPVNLAYVRSQFAIASAVAGIRGPIDGPVSSLNPDDVTKHVLISQSSGMTGKLSLFTEQCGIINRSLSPSENDIRKAQEFLTDFSSRGQLIRHASDVFQLAHSRKTLKLSEIYQLDSSTSCIENK